MYSQQAHISRCHSIEGTRPEGDKQRTHFKGTALQQTITKIDPFSIEQRQPSLCLNLSMSIVNSHKQNGYFARSCKSLKRDHLQSSARPLSHLTNILSTARAVCSCGVNGHSQVSTGHIRGNQFYGHFKSGGMTTKELHDLIWRTCPVWKLSHRTEWSAPFQRVSIFALLGSTLAS